MSSSLTDSALRYAARRSWAIFPLHPQGKVPLHAAPPGQKGGCWTATADVATVEAWWAAEPAANIGLHTGPASGVFVLDIDAEPPADGGLNGPDALAALEALHGALPPTLTSSTGGGGQHRFFRVPEGRALRNRVAMKGPNGERTSLDVRAEGGYVVLPPSVHPSGRPYQWVGSVREAVEAPAWLLDLIDPPRRERPTLAVVSGPPGVGAQRYGQRALEAACRAIAVAPEGDRHGAIYRESAAIGELVGGGCIGEEEALGLLCAAGEATGKGHKEVYRTVRHALSAGMANPRGVPERDDGRSTAGGVAPRRRAAWEDGPPAWMEAGPPVEVASPERVAAVAGVADPTEEDAPGGLEDRMFVGDPSRDALSVDEVLSAGEDGGPDGTQVVTDDGAPRMTDLGNARRLVGLHGADIRWCGAMPGTGWMTWDGVRWRPDETRGMVRLAATVAGAWRAEGEAIPVVDKPAETMDAEERASQAKRKKLLAWALRCESAGAIKNMVELATALPEVTTRREQYDADPYLFGTPNAVLDLRRAVAYPPRREDLLTRTAGIGVIVREACPTWLRFLHVIMGGDDELVGFLQRAAGYCMTGDISEQCMFIAHGSGRNGKSTFMEALRTVMGDYARNAPIETFVGRREGSIPNDLAMLAGARMVTCAEPQEGGALNEGLVKLATGDDVVTARFLNREFFDFRPQFKLWMLTNHKPIIRGTDNGIWRRLRLVPFTVTIPEDEVDRDLPRKLRSEAPGILQWMLDGCGDWRAGGLRPPLAVTQATADYRAEMDVVAQFIADRCDTSPEHSVSNGGLYSAFRVWCKEVGEFERSQRWFSLRLKEKGYRQGSGRSGLTGRTWQGLQIQIQPSAGWGSMGARGDA